MQHLFHSVRRGVAVGAALALLASPAAAAAARPAGTQGSPGADVSLPVPAQDVTERDGDLSAVDRLYIAGGFGHYINVANAVNIGLIPPVPADRIEFAGNTSLRGSRIAALHEEAFSAIADITKNMTYYDLMGAEDYVEEFRKAMFLPHTDIEAFQAHTACQGVKRR